MTTYFSLIPTNQYVGFGSCKGYPAGIVKDKETGEVISDGCDSIQIDIDQSHRLQLDFSNENGTLGVNLWIKNKTTSDEVDVEVGHAGMTVEARVPIQHDEFGRKIYDPETNQFDSICQFHGRFSRQDQARMLCLMMGIDSIPNVDHADDEALSSLFVELMLSEPFTKLLNYLRS
jgi:hypothetical protein